MDYLTTKSEYPLNLPPYYMVQNSSNIEFTSKKNSRIKAKSNAGILNIPTYHPGELLHSYLQKTSLRNGFKTFDDFMKRIQGLPKLHYGASFSTGYDAMTNFQSGIKFPDDFDWLRSGTLFSTLNSFSSVPPENRLKEYTKNVVFRNDEANVPNFIHDLYVCPECMKGEGDDWYYHTIHQIPYLTYCPVHGTRLLRYNGVKCHEADKPTFEEIKPFPHEDRLSSFSRAILESNIDCSVYSIIGVINTRLNGLSIPFDINPFIEERIELVDNIPFAALQNFVEHKITLPVKNMIALVAYLFDTPDDFLSLVPRGADYKSEFKAVIKNRFRMLTSYCNDAVKLQCLNCGDIFYANPPAFIRNPVCSKEVNGYE